MDRTQTHRRRITAGRAAVATLVAALGASCVPPAVAAPPLPDGVGVQLLRDVGGTLNDDGDQYLPDFRAVTILDGVETGPTPVSHAAAPVTYVESVQLATAGIRPDGTAKQPWNGFAGEGVELIGSGAGEVPWVLQFPGGTCSLGTPNPFFHITSVTPSPDGSMAVVAWSEDSPVHYVVVVSLVDAPGCPWVVDARYVSGNEPTNRRAGSAFVWAPDSAAIVYSLRSPGPGIGEDRLVRLDVSPGAVPVDVVAPSTDDVIPMGWSVGDRLLFARRHDRADGAFVSSLVTRAVGGGAERSVDRSVDPTPWVQGLSSARFAHFGYYVPGTTSIVYQDGSSTATNDDGLTFPWFDVRLVADTADAASKSIHGTRLPVAWHDHPVLDPPVPLPDVVTDVPSIELVERFVR